MKNTKSFEFFLEGDIADRLSSFRFGKDSTTIYLHLPKAAGNTSLFFLKKKLTNYFDVQWDNLDNSWKDLLEVHNINSYQLVSGHMTYKHLKAIPSSIEAIKTVTFIRNPVDRLISEYRYKCTPVHPERNLFLESFPTFESFALEYVSPNIIAETLVGGAKSLQDFIDKAKDTYQFIGISEMFNTSMYMLCTLLGIDYFPIPKRNVTLATDTNAFEISQKTYQKIIQRNIIDMQFYDWISQQYFGASDQILGHMCREKLA